jgi:xanthine dehydrogenase YagT iron-sulfur-binding subunit
MADDAPARRPDLTRRAFLTAAAGASAASALAGCAPTSLAALMSGNICRCGAYPNIVAAIQRVRRGA